MLARAHASLLLVACLVAVVVGHGWQVDPVPLSGGGQGTSSASTSSPCGQSQNFQYDPATLKLTTLYKNSNFTVTYQRANGHGGSALDVTWSVVNSTKTRPVQADFGNNNQKAIVLGKTYMDTTISRPQSGQIYIPTSLPTGEYVLQFHWNAQDGSSWWDCAYVDVRNEITGPNQCAVPVTPCVALQPEGNANATRCIPNDDGTPNCKCSLAAYGPGLQNHTDGTPFLNCTMLPPRIQVIYTVRATTVNQNLFTAQMLWLLQADYNAIIYDAVTTPSTKDTSFRADDEADVSFYLLPNPIDGRDPIVLLQKLVTLLTTGGNGDDRLLNQTFPVVMIVSEALRSITPNNVYYVMRNDIDECAGGPGVGNNCDVDGTSTCTNVIPYFYCTCVDGHTGDGTRCCPWVTVQLAEDFNKFDMATFKTALAAYLQLPSKDYIVTKSASAQSGPSFGTILVTAQVTFAINYTDCRALTQKLYDDIQNGDSQGKDAFGYEVASITGGPAGSYQRTFTKVNTNLILEIVIPIVCILFVIFCISFICWRLCRTPDSWYDKEKKFQGKSLSGLSSGEEAGSDEEEGEGEDE